MTRLLPYPLLAFSLFVLWLLLNRVSVGHLVLGTIVAFVAARAMAALHPAKPRLRRWDLIPKLVGIALYDILRSNLAVARLILQGERRDRVSGFVSIPLDLHDRTALSVLAVIITSTPGTAWVEYESAKNVLLIHVFDLVSEDTWIELIKNRYESLLMEIFE